MKTTRKILLSVGAVGSAAGIAGLGTFAQFTDSDSATATISTGTVTIDLADAGADNRLNVGAAGMVPGDSLQRRVVLTNDGSEALGSLTLATTAATPTNVLTTDSTNGLQMKVERCTGAGGWRESATTPYTYTCDAVLPGDNAGVRSSVAGTRAIIGNPIALASMNALASGGIDDMVVTVVLPSTADNTFQNKSATITYTFNATQRAAVSK